MAKLDMSPSKLKKIGKIISDRAAQEDAEILPLSGRHRTGDPKAMAKLFEKHIDGVASLKPEFEALMARNEARAEAQIKKLRTQALKVARSRKPALDRMIAQRVQAFETLAHPADPVPSASYWVNTPIEIYSTRIELDSWSIDPNFNWAKFLLNFRKGKQLSPTVVFRFVWENSTDKYVVINASTFMIPHGSCEIQCNSGIFFNDEHYAYLKMLLMLHLIDYTTEPYPYLGDEHIEAFRMRVDGGGITPNVETQYVAGAHIVKERIVLVPPRTAVGLHTIAYMSVETGEDSGKVYGDFISNGYGVIVPGVLIEVLS